MLRVAKPEGFGNIVLEDVPMPECGPRQVRVQSQVSLISRGSEILRRYMHSEAIDPAIMGYSVAGVVDAVGAEAGGRFRVGDRVMAMSPHAQYVTPNIDDYDGSTVRPLPDDMTVEQAAFLPLCTGAVWWAHIAGVQPGDTVVVLGQGLVGNLVMQAVRHHLHEQVIAVDVLEARCRLAEQLGADAVINASQEDPVAAVQRLTHGAGANVVIDCVGGRVGITSFAQAQEMVADLGTIHLIALYHGEPLPLDAGKMQRKRLIGGYFSRESAAVMLARAIDRVQAGWLRVEPLISHRFPFQQAKAAYDLLYERPGEAMGVLLDWR